jgi:predicted transcriptional regulator
MQVKRITIRVPPELHQQLSQLAVNRSVSLNTLAVEALEVYSEALAADQERFPLRQLSALLAPAAEAAELTEEELLHYARQIRRRIWQERYEKAVQSLRSAQGGLLSGQQEIR